MVEPFVANHVIGDEFRDKVAIECCGRATVRRNDRVIVEIKQSDNVQNILIILAIVITVENEWWHV